MFISSHLVVEEQLREHEEKSKCIHSYKKDEGGIVN